MIRYETEMYTTNPDPQIAVWFQGSPPTDDWTWKGWLTADHNVIKHKNKVEKTSVESLGADMVEWARNKNGGDITLVQLIDRAKKLAQESEND